MRIAIIGAKGMLGSDVAEIFKSSSTLNLYDLTEGENIKQLDITKEKDCLLSLSSFRPDFIINCAAYTDVDGAEDNKELALSVNYYGVKNLVKAAKLLNSRIIHISTDYVFDGNNHVYEENIPNPLNYYGLTKYLGEQACLEYKKATIIRTSWLYNYYKNNFPLKIGRKILKGEDVFVVNDQFGIPTSTKNLAKFISLMVNDNKYGNKIYHFTDDTDVPISWYGFALEIKEKLKKFNKKLGNVYPVETKNEKAKRPKNAVLKTRYKNLYSDTFYCTLNDFITYAVF